ncbi:restriction endonuclease subunit S [Chitinivorax sp. PXF-14]|uniref:restriction endonuclease subunit S n=1 Tax=Chitinivorax sp. PXF-14 TaxID=3230488 RepID=UPI00346693D1
MSSDSVRPYRFADLLSEPLRNGIYKSKEHHGSGIKVVNMGELFGHPRLRNVPMKRLELTEAELRKSSLKEGDLLFARRSLVAEGAGRCSIVKEIAEATTFESSIIRARPNPSIADSDYLYYFFASPQGRELMGTILRQVAVSGITGGDLAELQIPLPPLREQRTRASVMEALDDRITLLRETNATLEAIAQALFKSWFVDFDPVRAKMEGRTPEGMDEATAALFPDGFETSELGEVPRGWRVGTLSDIAFLNAQSWTVRNAPSEVAYVDLAGVKSNVFDEPQSYAFSAAPSRARRVLRTGDCIVGTVRPGNRSFGFIAHANNNLTGSTGFAVLSPKQKEMTAFVYLGATREDNIDRLSSLADGGAYPAVKPELVVATTCVLPTDSVMQEFDEVARPLLDSIGSNSAQAQSLASLRNTLLPRLISGQLLATEARKETNIY